MAVAPTVREYERHLSQTKSGGLALERGDHNKLVNLYYDLVTDFYEYGWGRSFHFAPRVPGESFRASLARHEHYLAHVLGRSAPGWSSPTSVAALAGR